MKLPKYKHLYTPIIATGLMAGFASSQLYSHNIWAAIGFALASVSWWITHKHAEYLNKLLFANRVMNESMGQLMRDLHEQGIIVTQVEVEGEADSTSVELRKDLH